jgi:predicted AlkP superfamily pyrophosphatase or phosphodiesterase
VFRKSLATAAALLAPVALTAQTAPPKLLVVISVDQFSADLFAEHRASFTGGLKRLAGGIVFPSGYQSHAATETCPGHSTILTGARPARSGIVANTWIDQTSPRGTKPVYCAEDERVAGSTSRAYEPSTYHLLTRTLGERMKAANPASRNVAVAGKDRAAIMMGGHGTDAIWFPDAAGKSFRTLSGATGGEAEARATNALFAKQLAAPAKAMKLSPHCLPYARAVSLGGTLSVGDGRFARKADDTGAFRASPEMDAMTLDLATRLVDAMKLGRGSAPDVIAVGLSATDYVGHRYGTAGSETCIQLTELDAMLGRFFAHLDKARIDYAVALTADHGGHDTPERNRIHALPEAARIDAALSVSKLDAQLVRELGVAAPVVVAADLGDLHFVRTLTPDQRARAEASATATLRANPQIAAVFTRAEIAATPSPASPPESWTLAERARASYHPTRSGDLIVMLKPRVTPIPEPTATYVATHGSPWDYDRRVPVLFWRKGLAPFEQPNSVETVDIAPTLAALIGLPLPASEIEGRCLDLLAGPESSCR